MARVLTNNTGLAYAVEESQGVLPTSPVWNALEPNTVTTFGANISTVARTPISSTRQRRKGSLTDVDSSVEFETDLTMSAFRSFIDGFVFADTINADVTDIKVTAVAGGASDEYTVAAITTEQAAKLKTGALIWGQGFASSANNGLKTLDANVAAAATKIGVTQNLGTEAAVPANATVSFCGFRIASSSSPTWTYNSTSKQATLALTGVGTTARGLGLNVGQFVHIGSIASAGADIDNAFQNTNADDVYGFARVVSIADDSIVFDKLASTLMHTDSTAPSTAVDVLFGEFTRNVGTGDSAYNEKIYQFEAEFPNLEAVGSAAYEYAIGNYCNAMSFNLPITDKAVLSLGFVGQDTEALVAARKNSAASRIAPRHTSPLNTSLDIARLRILKTDESGLSSDFKSLTLTIANNVSGEKVLGFAGSKFINIGNFEVNIEGQMLFTNKDVPAAIRNNDTLSIDTILRNDDGVVALDIPSMTLGGGGRDYPINETVLINVTANAFEDDDLGTSIGASTFPVPLPAK